MKEESCDEKSGRGRVRKIKRVRAIAEATKQLNTKENGIKSWIQKPYYQKEGMNGWKKETSATKSVDEQQRWKCKRREKKRVIF